MHTQLIYCFAAMVARRSQCDLATFVKKVILRSDTVIDPSLQAIICHYSKFQAPYDRMLSWVTFKKGLLSSADIHTYFNSLLVIVDLMLEIAAMSNGLFTKHVHHQNLIVLYIVQNIFSSLKTIEL